jgi:hypothetical protein
MMTFFNLWSNWGATLYGEVRGASDFRQNIFAMAGALVATSITAVILFLLFAKDVRLGLLPTRPQRVLGRDDPDRRVAVPRPPGGIVPPGRVPPVRLIAILSLWFFGWVGTVFLSSTRVVFAARSTACCRGRGEGRPQRRPGDRAAADARALDRDRGAVRLQHRLRDLHARRDAGDRGDVPRLDVAAAILPWRKRDIYMASPIAKYKVLGIPLITAAATCSASSWCGASTSGSRTTPTGSTTPTR